MRLIRIFNEARAMAPHSRGNAARCMAQAASAALVPGADRSPPDRPCGSPARARRRRECAAGVRHCGRSPGAGAARVVEYSAAPGRRPTPLLRPGRARALPVPARRTVHRAKRLCCCGSPDGAVVPVERRHAPTQRTNALPAYRGAFDDRMGALVRRTRAFEHRSDVAWRGSKGPGRAREHGAQASLAFGQRIRAVPHLSRASGECIDVCGHASRVFVQCIDACRDISRALDECVDAFGHITRTFDECTEAFEDA